MDEPSKIGGLKGVQRPPVLPEPAPSAPRSADNPSRYEEAKRAEAPPTFQQHREAISNLAQKLTGAALDSDFDGVVRLLRGKDAKSVAQALHQMPIDAAVAQILVAQKFKNPAAYQVVLCLLDIYSPPGSKTLLRDRVTNLLGRIRLTAPLTYRDESEAVFQTLSLLARMAPRGRVSSLAGPHEREGVDIVSVVQEARDPEDFILFVQKGNRGLVSEEDHPGFHTEGYRKLSLASKAFSNVFQTQFINPEGNLVVRNDTYHEGRPSGEYEYTVFDRSGLVLEDGKHPSPASNATPHWSRYYYDREGRVIRLEGYQNDKLFLTLKYFYDEFGNQTGEGEWAQGVMVAP